MRWLLLCLLAGALALPASAAPALDSTAPAGYQFGVFPFAPLARVETLFGPFALEFARWLGRPVAFRTRATYRQFAQALAAQAFDLAFVTPSQYVEISAPRGYVPLARNAERLSAIFIVRDDSPMRALADLADGSLGLPPADSTVTRLALQHLRAAGVAPSRTHDFDSHDSCVQAVLADASLACATMRATLDLFLSSIQQRRAVRTIARTQELPGAVFVAAPAVDAEQRAQLRRGLLALADRPEGRKLLHSTGLPQGLLPSVDADFDVLRGAEWSTAADSP